MANPKWCRFWGLCHSWASGKNKCKDCDDNTKRFKEEKMSLREILDTHSAQWIAIAEGELLGGKDPTEVAISSIEQLLPTEEEMAELITQKCREIHAEWWEKDAEVYAKALRKLCLEKMRGEE